ncbi:MAG: hypothetical protein CR962_01510 [Gammaproteobacteria bacterium]|nr:MAG: hypothetical protein CR962_01510 [Gammaproteobacteria bacterium]
MEKKRYYDDNVGPVKENELLAFKKALELCNEIGDITQITLLIHTKANTGYLERIFGTRDLKAFFRGVKIDSNYPPLKIETIRTFNDDWQGKKILVAFGLNSDELYKYDDYQNISVIIAHQWSEDSLKDWARCWGAINLKTGIKIEKNTLPNKVVQQAFIDLTDSINLSTGITHPMDEEQCKTYIRALKKYNYELLIDKVNSGRHFKGGEKTGLQNHIKRWESK